MEARRRATLTLKQEFQKLTGTLGSTPITDAKMNGDEITFTAGERRLHRQGQRHDNRGQGRERRVDGEEALTTAESAR